MIDIDNKLLSTDLFKEFVCNLSACKGACCVAGNAGAPVEEEEVAILESIYPKVKPYLTEKGIREIEKGNSLTVLRKGNAHNRREGMRIHGVQWRWCGALWYWEGLQWRCHWLEKTISCHLYPIRIARYTDFEALNYDRWSICSAACSSLKN